MNKENCALKLVAEVTLLYVISIKHRLSLRDDGSHVIPNMLE